MAYMARTQGLYIRYCRQTDWLPVVPLPDCQPPVEKDEQSPHGVAGAAGEDGRGSLRSGSFARDSRPRSTAWSS